MTGKLLSDILRSKPSARDRSPDIGFPAPCSRSVAFPLSGCFALSPQAADKKQRPDHSENPTDPTAVLPFLRAQRESLAPFAVMPILALRSAAGAALIASISFGKKTCRYCNYYFLLDLAIATPSQIPLEYAFRQFPDSHLTSRLSPYSANVRSPPHRGQRTSALGFSIFCQLR